MNSMNWLWTSEINDNGNKVGGDNDDNNSSFDENYNSDFELIDKLNTFPIFIDEYAKDISNPTNKNLIGCVGIGQKPNGYRLSVNGSIFVKGHISNRSDERLKTDITTIKTSNISILNMLRTIHGYKYKWDVTKFSDMNEEDSKTEIGLIAQEVELSFPEIVSVDSNNIKSIDYTKMVPILLEAIHEQQEMIKHNEIMINSLSPVIDEISDIKKFNGKVDKFNKDISEYIIKMKFYFDNIMTFTSISVVFYYFIIY
jgi:hypothetical protein